MKFKSYKQTLPYTAVVNTLEVHA